MALTQGGLVKESRLMRLSRSVGLESLAWSLRRLHCPVSRKALVLEVGSGGSPYFRSNVLCDAYEESVERFYAPLVCDRPTVLAFGERLPFKDDTFDFVIASHVLEHSSDPERFLSELQRVARAGYIEVPDAFMERLTAYGFHKLEISDSGDRLDIRKKNDYIQDREIVSLFEKKAKGIFVDWASRYPFNFHVRYYWSRKTGGIRFNLVNPECSVDWSPPEMVRIGEMPSLRFMERVKRDALRLIRKLFSQTRRNRNVDLLELLKCPSCGATTFIKTKDDKITCKKCNGEVKVEVPASSKGRGKR